MRQLLSFSEYAKHRKVTPAAVSQAVASGRITPVVDTRGRRRIDPEIADMQWSKNTDPMQSERASGTRSAAKSPDGGGGGGENGSPYWDARTRREQSEAAMAEMKQGQMAGELVERSRVEAAACAYGRMIRDSVLGVPTKIAPGVSHLTDPWEIEQLISAALRQVLDDVAKMTASDLERALSPAP
mgnify:CR=1 FL=1